MILAVLESKTDAAKLTNVRIARFRECKDLVRECEVLRWITLDFNPSSDQHIEQSISSALLCSLLAHR